ncbi:MAG: DUF4157 domain-containing protein [Gammaproteobacteria bacterium]|nr:DUF4157 domain-containing protein [Gammaproteobacteria bacterium]
MSMPLQTRVKAARKPKFTPVRGGVLQRECACSQHTTAGGECAECRAKRLGLQRRTSHQAESITAPPIVHEVLRSPGRPLDPSTRTFMESRFGHDFSQVRVHTDAKATESAGELTARAYTAGRDIVFAAGQYAPKTTEGRQLLAHELTHVVQQGQSLSSSKARSLEGQQGRAYEREAEWVARGIQTTKPFNAVHDPRQISPPVLMRQEAVDEAAEPSPTCSLTKCERSVKKRVVIIEGTASVKKGTASLYLHEKGESCSKAGIIEFPIATTEVKGGKFKFVLSGLVSTTPGFGQRVLVEVGGAICCCNVTAAK